MGKFYLDNKATWFEHMAERAHAKRLAEGGGLFGGGEVEIDEDLRFYYSLNGTPSRRLRLIDFGQDLIAVESGNGLIGHLDKASSAVMRQYFKDHPNLHDMCPAYLVGHEEFSDSYIVRLGMGPSK